MMPKIAMLLYAGVTALFLLGPLVMVPCLNAQMQLQVYGLWHCSSDACSWASAPNMTTFGTQNHWIIDRGQRLAVRESGSAELREPAQADESHDRFGHD
jgi:hypothetical protein